jgi:hypothetical protein
MARVVVMDRQSSSEEARESCCRDDDTFWVFKYWFTAVIVTFHHG